MTNYKTLQFTFGSPQDFISQSRRTRDLFSASYIMSYLAGRAMYALEKANDDIEGKNTIIFPAVEDDPLMQAIRTVEQNKAGKEKLIGKSGSLPNRFSARIPVDKDGKICVSAVCDAWKNISDKAWEHLKCRTKDISAEERPNDFTKSIWDEQVKDTWDFAWVIGDKPYLLNQRKNLRTHFPRPEAGEKCTICGERQALWNNRSTEKESQRKTVRHFWTGIAKGFKGMHLRADGGERLCAVCFIKRIFPLIAMEAIGWKLGHNYPSTPYLAAIDWLIQLFRMQSNTSLDTAVSGFVSAGKAASKANEALAKPTSNSKVNDTRILSENKTRIKEIEELLPEKDPCWKKFKQFDGASFFPDGIRNEREFLPYLVKKDDNGLKREKLLNALSKLCGAAGGVSPTPFYALLLMDGDKMGDLLREKQEKVSSAEHQKNVSDALSLFTKEVPGLVSKHNGVLVYAGGDDVFALMPLNSVLKCAEEIKEAYVCAFSKKVGYIDQEKATISAAVLYSHMSVALGTVVRDAHDLLDKVAKRRTGRNAFAVRIWKRGGPIVTFAKPWSSGSGKWTDELEKLKEAFEDDYSSKFFYHLRELFGVLEPPHEKTGNVNIFSSDKQKTQLLTSEYMKSRERSLSLEEAEEKVKRLVNLCRQKRKCANGDIIECLDADGVMLLRFLENKEI